MSLLEVKGLCKDYGTFKLKDITFDLPEGYIMGYIGRNGSGKTTTLNAISHLIKTDGGEVRLDGITFKDDPVRFRDMIGYIGDSAYYPINFTTNNICSVLKDFYASFDPVKFKDYCDRWELPANKQVKSMSRGMLVKLMFAGALSRETRILILDEATNGLDPIVRREVLHLLQDYISDGRRSILFSTHIMEDLQDIADYIIMIDRGHILVSEPRDVILEKYLLVKGGNGDLTDELRSVLIGTDQYAYGFSGLFPTDCGAALPGNLTVTEPTIDEVAVHLLLEENKKNGFMR